MDRSHATEGGESRNLLDILFNIYTSTFYGPASRTY